MSSEYKPPFVSYLWTSDGWQNPMGAPDLDPVRDPWHGYAGEDCAKAFDDEGLTAWYLDQE